MSSRNIVVALDLGSRPDSPLTGWPCCEGELRCQCLLVSSPRAAHQCIGSCFVWCENLAGCPIRRYCHILGVRLMIAHAPDCNSRCFVTTCCTYRHYLCRALWLVRSPMLDLALPLPADLKCSDTCIPHLPLVWPGLLFGHRRRLQSLIAPLAIKFSEQRLRASIGRVLR